MRSVLERVRGFDERHGYYEDRDLARNIGLSFLLATQKSLRAPKSME